MVLNKALLSTAALAVLLATFGGAPAAAAVIITTGNDPTFEVLKYTAPGLELGPATTVQGETNSGTRVDFITGDANNLLVQGNQISAEGGSLFNFLTFQAQTGQSLTKLIFNLNVSEDATVTFSTAPNGADGTTAFDVSGNGENFFTITADPGEFASVTLSLSAGGLEDVGQVRTGTGDQTVVPEPSSILMVSGAAAFLLWKRRRA